MATLIQLSKSGQKIENMADAAAARREARRKRILENSQNRLQLISGIKSSDECLKASTCTVSSSKERYDVSEASSSVTVCYQPDSNGTITPQLSETYPLLAEVPDTVAAGDTETEILNDFTNFISTKTRSDAEKVSSTTWEKIMSYKYDIVLLVLINQMLSFLFSYESAYFFIPLVIYTATRLVWFPTEKKSQMADMFLLMNGMSASRVQKITVVMQYLTEITLDVCVYLFVTICIQSLLATLTSTMRT